MLDCKSELKVIIFSSSFKFNEIHKVDSPFNEDPRNIIFFQGGPNFDAGTAGNFDPLLTQKPKKLEQPNFVQL